MFVKSLEPRASGEAAAAFESSSQCALEGHGFLSEEAQSLLQQNKLVLVLDLDQTLIDSTVDEPVRHWLRGPPESRPQELWDVEDFAIGDTVYYMKPRPGLPAFLEQASARFQLHAFTAGTRHYAGRVLKRIDPGGRFFGHDRLVSRDETLTMDAKDLSYVSSNKEMHRLCLIVDDRADVWSWSHQLLKIVPYNFWACRVEEALRMEKEQEQAEQGALQQTRSTSSSSWSTGFECWLGTDSNTAAAAGEPVWAASTADSRVKVKDSRRPRSLKRTRAMVEEELESESESSSCAGSDDEQNAWLQSQTGQSQNARSRCWPALADEDAELESLTDLINHMHDSFFHRLRASCALVPNQLDTALIVGTERLQILKDFKIAFADKTAAYSEVFFWAEAFGASVSTDIALDTTHVIASLPRGHRKALAPVDHNRTKVVWPSWLYTCIARWERADEEPFLFPNLPALLDDELSLLSEQRWLHLSPQVVSSRRSEIDYFRVRANLDEVQRSVTGSTEDAIDDSGNATVGSGIFSDEAEAVDTDASSLDLSSDTNSESGDENQENRGLLHKSKGALRSTPRTVLTSHPALLGLPRVVLSPCLDGSGLESDASAKA